ncbi:hypothetical protein MNVI_09610 [Mycobacterium noviomagense]|uniref:Uncharacterized protein n=1 Tax=Mycobacterium noviomagense TaxID=459858 RepID=A0A7I7PAM1_9MYCO|nr:hypothetical protein MNVI_09610 [Mycobacterium noviomagense]
MAPSRSKDNDGWPGQSKYTELVPPPCKATTTARGAVTSVTNADIGTPSALTIRGRGAFMYRPATGAHRWA